LESFLLAIAAMFFLFQLIGLLDLLYRVMPAKTKSRISGRLFARTKGLLRILAVVMVGLVVIYTQKHFFPEWLWKYSWWRYLIVVIVVALVYIVGRILDNFLGTMTKSLQDREDKIRLHMILTASHQPLYLLLTAIATHIVGSVLNLSGKLEHFISVAVNMLVVSFIALFVYRLLDVIEYELNKFVQRDDNRFDQNLVQMVRIVARFLVIVLGAIYLLQAITGKPMNTLLAGLGIGGLAVALAAQDTLKNLFGSLMIMMDKPFIVGDWVKADDVEGVVEEIGFRSTRIRTFPGHLISIPNDRMASVNIDNVQRRPGIRRRTDITITYDTPPDKVQRAVDIIRGILTGCEEIHPDYPVKVFFDEFNDMSLNILVNYWYRQNHYWEAKAFDEKVNFMILRAFEAEGIEFAFPTTTTYLAHDERRPLKITVTKGSKDGE
jgi:MscS family membrane protein